MAKLIRSEFFHVDLVRYEYDDDAVITQAYAPDGTKQWRGYWPNCQPVIRDHDVAGWQFFFPSRSELEAVMGREGYGPQANESKKV